MQGLATTQAAPAHVPTVQQKRPPKDATNLVKTFIGNQVPLIATLPHDS